MGSSPQVIQAPTPPAAMSAGQSAKEQAAAMETILASQLEYQPQFDQQAFESFSELAPQYAQVSQDVLEEYNPNQTALTEDLAAQFLEGSQQGLPDDLKAEFLNTFKANVFDPSSPVGASAVAKNLMMEDLAFRQFNQNAGLSFLGRAPVTQAYQNPSQFQVGNSFGQAFSTGTQGQNAFIAGSRPLGFTQGQTTADAFSQYAGGLGGLMSGFGSAGQAMGMGG